MGADRSPDPLEAIRKALPHVEPFAVPTSATGVTLGGVYDAWRQVTVCKPRTAKETEYALTQLGTFLGHDDATRLTRDDLRRWRDQTKELHEAGQGVGRGWSDPQFIRCQPAAW